MTVGVAHPLDLSDAATAVVRAAGLGRSIDGRPILRDLCFSVRPGDSVAVLGANGAGKSTLLRVIATLMPATEGTLTLFGRPAGRASAGLRARIGLIGHASMLYRDLSPRENLTFYGRLYGVPDPVARADELLAAVDLRARGDDPVRTFSRGMVQRVSIARALVADPELLLADEPFGGLDTGSRDQLERILEGLRGDGRTVIVAGHDLEWSRRALDRVLVLHRGRLVLDAPASSVDLARLRAEVARRD